MYRILAAASSMALMVGLTAAAPPKSDKNQKLTNDEWKGVSTAPLKSSEIDQLVAKEQEAVKVKPSSKTTDEQFIRRVMLELTGRLPLPADVTEFVADRDANKRTKLVDKLLDSDDYAKHWSRYWRDVFMSKVTDMRGRAGAPSFEAWLAEQFQKNQPWDRMARELLTATGTQPIRLGRPVEPDAKNGVASFMLSYQGVDAINDRTAETARIFLGIQIQCAQCHDHPFDGWKQEQFHELASYFAKLGERPVFEMVNEKRQITGIELISKPFGEHKMPDRDNPRSGKTMSPKFLDGRTLSTRTNDGERRQSLADAITKDNYYFAAALVNRMWGELMGQAFCQPIDDMGPGKTPVMPAVLARVSAGFKGSGYDVKALLRSICNSDTYQRQIRPGDSSEEHLQFAGIYPTRLRADALWQSLVTVLGSMGQPMPGGNPFAARFSLEGQFKEEFRYDPSLPPDEVESSIPQALMLMNNSQIQTKIRAQGTNLLGRILTAYPKEEDAIRMVYLRTLARKPTDRERDKALGYVKKSNRRSEAYEDLLWALLNSTEFQTKR
jgi:Protein of unknown function (DUF1549)/Protein of unknown function (DUF1553)